MSDYEKAFAKLDQFVRERIAAYGTPGLVLAVTDREKTIHIATYGQANIDRQTPVSAETSFEIGSIGKSFTAIALLQQHELGKLDLHAPVTTYLPWFKAGSEDHPITIHHLLSHTAGITEGSDQATDSRYEVWDLRNTHTVPPGGDFYYSNVGYKVLGLVLEAVTGLTYGEALQQLILGPLGMDKTDPIITHETREKLATGYAPLYDDRPVGRNDTLIPAAWVETDTGDGSIAAPVEDMAAYTRMLLNRGQGPDGPLISAESFDLLSSRITVRDASTFYGYGMTSADVDGHLYVGHGGDMPGFQSQMNTDMDAGFGVCIMLNGPGRSLAMEQYALTLLRAAKEGRELPDPVASNDPTLITNVADYAGTYSDGTLELTFVAADDHLLLDYAGERIILDDRSGDHFYAAHLDFSRFLFSFGRDEEERVVEVSWGGHWYRADSYRGPTTFEVPAEWRAYVGHYRAHNPWVSNFRVVERKGSLLLIGAEGYEDELVPLEDGQFEIEHTPERLRFDTIVEGNALHVRRSGGDYYHFFTP